ncbi:MAG: TlpA family protein disulfide reductase [Nannocystaceae bacterium]|nr:TlpA family protein disulfide reductase [Nannocystaceae bacterium]
MTRVPVFFIPVGRCVARVAIATLGLASLGCSSPVHTGETGAPAEAELDVERLDRQQACMLGGDSCGYPSAGAEGYGTNLGERMANFVLTDCSGTEREFAELFAPDADGVHETRAVLFSLGAGWCEPCKEETEHLPAVFDEFRDEGLAIVQVLFQDENAQRPTGSFCEDWVEDYGLAFTVLIDPVWDFYPTYLEDVQAATPVTLLVDANANIRYKLEGQVPPNIELEIAQVLETPYEAN